ncbi:MAG: efflux RND transporter permease subunit [Bdellovibrionales bacterium]|nr:efflux RND transporter permease subunit [Bdellovibrionales bacterium]
MNPARLAVKNPIFIASIVILLLTLGALALKTLPIDLYPDVNFPTIVVHTIYPGAGPLEVESGVSRLIEDELSAISGLQKVSSQNREGESVVIAEFNLKSDLNYAEQQVRAKVTNIMRLLPLDVDSPVIKKMSPSDAPIMGVALQADMPDGKLYDLAKEKIAPQFEQAHQVGQVDILGGRKREIKVNLDMNFLNRAEISATLVAESLGNAGRNVPIGNIASGEKEYSYRALAEYKSIDDIKNTILRSVNLGTPVSLDKVATIEDSVEDEVSRTRFDGEKSIVFNVYRQSGANSVFVADQIAAIVKKINKDFLDSGVKAKLTIVNDMSRRIRANVFDVYESIGFGIILTILVVYLFLGSLKSTLITGFALPNSLLGAFIFMSFFGFSINIMSLLALSLVVGLLVDDAIVVRENIFRKLEAGLSPKMASIVGTQEVTLAVVATTLTILAVFGPIGNLQGIVGQFFKEFGLTVCFAMLVSLFDGLFVAPALSAYLGGGDLTLKEPSKNKFAHFNRWILLNFEKLQTWLELKYALLLKKSLLYPLKTLLIALGIFIGSIFIARTVPFTFLPPQDNGEFFVLFELPVGSSLDATDAAALKIENLIRQHPQVKHMLSTIGVGSESNRGRIFIELVGAKFRDENTTEMKNKLQESLKLYSAWKPIVTDQSVDGSRAFNLNLVGHDLETLIPYSEKVLAHLKKSKAIQQADTTYRPGKPEYQLALNPKAAAFSGIRMTSMGAELRTLIEGQTPAIFRENGIDYKVRVRLREDQRALKDQFNKIRVPNITQNLIPLSYVATIKEDTGPATILRESRTRYIQLSADIMPGGSGMGGAISELQRLFKEDLKPPPGVTFSFVGEAERFAELMTNMLISLGLGTMFIYLVLASLYGSFITPFTIMSVIPLAACGAFIALFITRSSFDLFSMIGCVMLMGLATKNSILLVDFAVEKQKQGVDRVSALLEAGATRLRPILMTSLAVIAGMIPVAIGLNEASKQRVSLGIVVIGGTISSTILTLVVIPATHIYIDRFQNWIIEKYQKVFGVDNTKI